MRKGLGKPTRRLFFERFVAAFPDFELITRYALKGFTWAFTRRAAPTMQCIWYRQHKHEDSFTLELSWSLVVADPAEAPLGSPQDPLTPQGCRFRLGAFWESGGDYWWAVADGPPDLLTTTPEEYSRALLHSEPVDLEVRMPRISAAVDDAISRVREWGLPYRDRVTRWAGR